MARREVEGLIAKLRQLSEEGAASFFSEVMASDRLRKGLGRAGERFLSNKQGFDRNVESILDFVNIPSKRDVRELKSRLDTLSTQLVNLSMKVDRMLAEKGSSAAPPRTRKGKAAASSPASAARQFAQFLREFGQARDLMKMRSAFPEPDKVRAGGFGGDPISFAVADIDGAIRRNAAPRQA